MKTRPMLTADDVQRLLEAAREEALGQQWAVTIAVVDDGGHPLGLLRLDGASPFTGYMATEKARTAAMGRRESKGYEDIINNGRTAFLSAPVLKGTLEGGVPIVVEGHVVGAVGGCRVSSRIRTPKSPNKPSRDCWVLEAGTAARFPPRSTVSFSNSLPTFA